MSFKIHLQKLFSSSTCRMISTSNKLRLGRPVVSKYPFISTRRIKISRYLTPTSIMDDSQVCEHNFIEIQNQIFLISFFIVRLINAWRRFSILDFSIIFLLDSATKLCQRVVLVDGFLERRNTGWKFSCENAEEMAKD